MQNAKEAQRGATAPSPLERNSGGPLCWACSSESKERDRDQGKEGGQKVEDCKRGGEKKWIEYLQQLWNEMLAENATLLGDTEGSQITGSKCKEVILKDEEV